MLLRPDVLSEKAVFYKFVLLACRWKAQLRSHFSKYQLIAVRYLFVSSLIGQSCCWADTVLTKIRKSI